MKSEAFDVGRAITSALDRRLLLSGIRQHFLDLAMLLFNRFYRAKGMVKTLEIRRD
jgi:hypothetical protein